MSKHLPAAGGFALAVGLFGGCAGVEPTVPSTPASTSAAATHQAIADDLDRLRALDVFEVGKLILGVPDESTACYGVPCPGWADKLALAEARQAPRLAQLVERASIAARAIAYVNPLDERGVAADLDRLRALQIVEVGSLLVTQPAASASCYNLPCPDDKARAEAVNRERTAKLDAITSAAGKE